MSENTELQIIEYRPTAAALAELGQRYKGVVYPCGTADGMYEAKIARAELRGYRTDLEKMRQTLKAGVLEKGRLIDGEAKDITAKLEALENPIDSQIKQEEQRKETERKAREEAERAAADAIQKRIAEIRNWPSRFIGRDSAAIGAELETLTALEDEMSGFGLYAGMAKQAHAECVATLHGMLGKAIAHEQEQERLEAERIETARVQAEEKAKIEADRADIARLQAEQTERLHAERASQEAELAEIRKAQDEEMRQARAEAQRIAEENSRAWADSEAKKKAEHDRLEAENRTRREEERKAEQAERYKARNEDLRRRLAEIQNQDTALENKLMLAYQMGRKDMGEEWE
jgi:colicin import membrane protein